MLHQYISRQSLQNPLVSETLLRCETLLRIPFQTRRDEVDKGIIWHISQLHHYVSDSFFLLFLSQNFARLRHRVIFELGKQMLPLRYL